MAASTREIVDGLREEIRRIERRPPRRAEVVPSGIPAVDAALSLGGFPRGALSELAGERASGKTAVALHAIASALGEGRLAAFVDGRGELYPPAAQALGVDLDRLLIVRPAPAGQPTARAGAPVGALQSNARRWIDEGAPTGRWVGRAPAGRQDSQGEVHRALWAAEALLASGAFAVVAIDVALERPHCGIAPAALQAMLRRLGLAAERGGAVGLWLAPLDGARIRAAVRLEVSGGAEVVRVRRTLGFGGGAPDVGDGGAAAPLAKRASCAEGVGGGAAADGGPARAEAPHAC